jgi:hypothetical protein
MSFKNYKEEFTAPAAVPLPALYNILGRADDTRDTEQFEKYGGPDQKSPDYSAFGKITGVCPCQLQVPNAIRLVGQRAVQGDPYIYSGSQRVCAILIRCFSVPSASEAL